MKTWNGHIKVEIKNFFLNLQWWNGEGYQRHKGLKHWERKRNQQLFFQHQFWFVQVYWEVYWVVGTGAIQIIQFIGSWMNQMHHNHVHCAPPLFLSQLDNLDSNVVLQFCCLWTCKPLLYKWFHFRLIKVPSVANIFKLSWKLGFNEANIVGKVSVRRCMGRPAANKCKLGETSASGKGGSWKFKPSSRWDVYHKDIGNKW